MGRKRAGRFKNLNWNLPSTEEGKLPKWDYVPIALLMDIRDELQRLNKLLGCANCVAIPRKLDQIEVNTRKEPVQP